MIERTTLDGSPLSGTTVDPNQAGHRGPSASAASPMAVADCAGALMGGARRYLDELEGWLTRVCPPVEILGRQRRLDGSWLIRREAKARCSGAPHALALNNVSFLSTSGTRTVLLRNALHFADPAELGHWPGDRGMARQAALVHLAMRRADRMVVPSASMANLVTSRCTWASNRVEVLHHPVSDGPVTERVPGTIICPVLDAPYKHLGERLTEAVDALDVLIRGGEDGLSLSLTMSEEEAYRNLVSQPSWVRLLGRLSTATLLGHIERASVIFYPCTVESFGYPLAEARIRRVPVVAPDTALAREVAGDALVGYEPGCRESLQEAFREALSMTLGRLTVNPYDPDRYFPALFQPENR
jgi:hypothetical protein